MQLNPFSSSFYRNPADAAKPFLAQIPETVKPYYEPYTEAGNESLSLIQKQYQQLLSNPSALMHMFGENFKESPGYQFQYNQGLNAANNAAASGGMLGTPYHQQTAASIASDLANKEYNDYYDRIFGLYGKGLSGYEGLNTVGYNASTGLADILSSNLLNQANLNYLGRANQNQANSDLFTSLLGSAAGIGKYFKKDDKR